MKSELVVFIYANKKNWIPKVKLMELYNQGRQSQRNGLNAKHSIFFPLILLLLLKISLIFCWYDVQCLCKWSAYTRTYIFTYTADKCKNNMTDVFF